MLPPYLFLRVTQSFCRCRHTSQPAEHVSRARGGGGSVSTLACLECPTPRCRSQNVIEVARSCLLQRSEQIRGTQSFGVSLVISVEEQVWSLEMGNEYLSFNICVRCYDIRTTQIRRHLFESCSGKSGSRSNSFTHGTSQPRQGAPRQIRPSILDNIGNYVEKIYSWLNRFY